jgi:hypothetical protein
MEMNAFTLLYKMRQKLEHFQREMESIVNTPRLNNDKTQTFIANHNLFKQTPQNS